MNRTDRLLAIVLELQGKGRQRAEDLAATFETSKRTIYRDIEALCEAGVPLVATPGRGYSLMDGYFLPPLSFSADEATMLLLGSGVMAQHFDAQYRTAAESASRKIAGVLPPALRDEVRMLQNSIHFIPSREPSAAQIQSKLQQLRRAILQHVRVQFTYQARHGSTAVLAPTTREANPHALIHISNAWYLTAYCHLRHDVRNFRLDRMDDLTQLATTFMPPTDFTSYPQRSAPGELEVRALFSHTVARWVRETPSFFTVNQEETPAGLLVTMQVRHERDVLQWLMGWGRAVQVLAPPSLQRMFAEEAEAMWRIHQSE